MKTIDIRGARTHNLKNIDLSLPRDKLIVFTGLSGSGKSSLAFDTIYAEGQRRYVESLSAYARQFLGEMQKPDVDQIEGLSPAISIDQKGTSRNPRSTVGTVTDTAMSPSSSVVGINSSGSDVSLSTGGLLTIGSASTQTVTLDGSFDTLDATGEEDGLLAILAASRE